VLSNSLGFLHFNEVRHCVGL